MVVFPDRLILGDETKTMLDCGCVDQPIGGVAWKRRGEGRGSVSEENVPQWTQRDAHAIDWRCGAPRRMTRSVEPAEPMPPSFSERINSTLASVVDGLCDPSRRRRVALGLVVAYAAAWMLYGVIAKSSQDINADMAEMAVWAREPALGYPKQPSNFLKIQALTFRIEKQFGRIGIRQNSLLIEFINSVLKGNTSHYLHSIFHAGFAYVCR